MLLKCQGKDRLVRLVGRQPRMKVKMRRRNGRGVTRILGDERDEGAEVGAAVGMVIVSGDIGGIEVVEAVTGKGMDDDTDGLEVVIERMKNEVTIEGRIGVANAVDHDQGKGADGV